MVSAPLFSFSSHLFLIKCVIVFGLVVGLRRHRQPYPSTTFPPPPPSASSTTTSPPSPPSFYNPPYLLSFPRNLLSTDVDGSLSLFNVDGFVHLKTLPSIYRCAINDLTFHPSNKLALSIGRDEFLARLNLVHGQRSFCYLLSKEANLMRFNSAAGDRFFMAVEDKLTVHKAEDAQLLFELDCQVCALFDFFSL